MIFGKKKEGEGERERERETRRCCQDPKGEIKFTSNLGEGGREREKEEGWMAMAERSTKQ